MSIICKICNSEFKKIIPWQHLKKHDMLSVDYKEKFGPLYSQETLDKFSTRIPHNKGKKISDPVKLAAHRERIKKRELRYQLGEFTRGATKTDEQKQRLSESSTLYAITHPEDMHNRARKAVVTKLEKNYDFGSTMRGKHHSEKTKMLLRIAAQDRIQQSSIESRQRIQESLIQLNLTLLNDIKEKTLKLSCNNCHRTFTFTKQYFSPAKFKKSMCPKCFPRHTKQSKSENELYQFVLSICPDAIQGYREKYHAKEIDIYIPSNNIGIEVNGLYWHSDEVLSSLNKSPKSDFEKHQYFVDKGVQLITIFEDEWRNKTNIVQSRLLNILGKTSITVYARQCVVKEVSSKDSAQFCNENHIMGKGRSNVRLGLYHNDILVSLMTFTNNNLSRKLQLWEINRFSSLLNVNVVGGGSKLFKHFVQSVKPTQVISYSDNRWSNGGLYANLGFTKISTGSPSYWYFLPNSLNRIHRFGLRKNKEDDRTLTEYENRRAQGFSRIWDCGHSKWIWTQK